MTRRLPCLTAVLLACAALAGVPPVDAHGDQGQQTFRANADVVQVDVSVRDGRRAITGLSAADFVVLDNGVPQTVTDASYGRLPIDITVLLDVSRSVTGPLLDQLRRAIEVIMRDLDADDRLRLVTFNAKVARTLDFTSDTAAVSAAIRAVTASGGSSIRDALGLALVSASSPDRRQLIVIFTDGADSSSQTSAAGLLRIARRTNASVTSVVPGRVRSAAANSPARRHLRELEALGEETGGVVLTAANNLSDTFTQALERFRSSYVLYFTPTGVARDGFHTLEVSVRGRNGYDLGARRGYFGR